MITELYELVETVKPVVATYVPDTPRETVWRREWLAKADRALADRVATSPEQQLLTEVWVQYRYATKDGYGAGGLSTLEAVQDYLTGRGVLDTRGNIIGVDTLFNMKEYVKDERT